MTRREMLVRMFGAAVAASVAPLIDLNNATVSFWNQPPVTALLGDKWRVTFPDGLHFSFIGEVVSESVSEAGNLELQILPTGGVDISKGPAEEERSTKAAGTLIYRAGAPEAFAEVRDIILPRMERQEISDGNFVMPGLIKRGSVTFRIKPFTKS